MNDMQFVKRQLIQCYFLVFLMIVTTASPCFAQASDLASKREEAIKIIGDAGGKVGHDEVLGPDGDVIHTSLYVDFNSQQGIMTNTYQPETTIEALAQLQAIEGIETVELSRNENIADEHLVYLKPLNNLKVLYLFRTKVRGEGLAHLANLENLKYVDLKETPCGDEGLLHLSKIKGLKYVGVDNTRVTDAGVVHLVNLAELETLRLSNTDITDKAVATIERLTSLKELGIFGTQISAAGLERLRRALPNCNIRHAFSLGKTPDDRLLFPENSKPTEKEINAVFKTRNIDGDLRQSVRDGKASTRLFLGSTTLSDKVVLSLIKKTPHLNGLIIRRSLVGDPLLEGLKDIDLLSYLELSYSSVSNEGLRHLSQLESIRELVLSGSAISDEGLQHLQKLSSLKQLSLQDTRVTVEGVEELREHLPDCHISY